MSSQGIRFETLTPTETADFVTVVNTPGRGVKILSGASPGYAWRAIISGQSPIDLPAMRNGDIWPIAFDRLEAHYGTLTNPPTPKQVELAIYQRQVVGATDGPAQSTFSEQREAAYQRALAVPATSAVSLIDDGATSDGYLAEHARCFDRGPLRNRWLVGWIRADAAFDVYVQAYTDASDDAVAGEPFIVSKFASQTITSVPAAVHATADHYAFTTELNFAGGAVIRNRGLPWPVGGGRLVVYNGNAGAITLHARFAFVTA